MSAPLRAIAAALCFLAALAGGAHAQGAPQTGTADASGALLPRQGPAISPMTAVSTDAAADEAARVSQLDYSAWNSLAGRAEASIDEGAATDAAYETLRSQIAVWREAFQSAQSANSARISTLRAQIDALGPAPSAGASEPEDLAKRRAELTGQLTRQQAPSIAAVEAYNRADGIIREIDRILRERQASELLQLWPSPINPANWPEAVIGLTDTGVRVWEELASKWAEDGARRALLTNAPIILALLAIGAAMILSARAWVQRFAMRLREGSSAGAGRVIALFASLGEVAFPLLGLLLVVTALKTAAMTGDLGTALLDGLWQMALPLILAAWMAGRIFPRGNLPGPLGLDAGARAEARVLTMLLGLMLGLNIARDLAMSGQQYSEATTAVTSYPGVVVAGLLLLRIGQLISRHLRAGHAREGEAQSFGRSSLLLIARAVAAVGILGPILGALGYVAAASAMVYPAILSLGLIAVLLICQHLVAEVYAMILRQTGADMGDGLLPVLANFAIAVASMPVFALIWGARVADLTEVWAQFREGFQFGATRISPSNFLLFALVFAIGYGLTRLLQGALRTTILPRTALDMGARNAAVSGVGYFGVFVAALIAINTAGIDLSGLAIVAGALSVGIGFGLQNIVSNFVSGIILLIERPVSEGDWIEVGGTMGTVKAISVRSTRIQTFDRTDVIVPNSDLISGAVTNYTRFNLTGRLVLSVGVNFSSDSRKVERILREIAESQPLVVMNPAPIIALVGFGADSINFEMRLILRDINQITEVRTEVNHEILRRFAEEKIEIPFAQNDVTLRNAPEIAQLLRAAAASVKEQI